MTDTTPLFINGEYTPGRANNRFANLNPCDGTQVAEVCEACELDVNDAMLAARRALTGPWGNLTVDDRKDLLYRVADEIASRADDFLEAECLDTGKPKNLAKSIDIPRAAANFRAFADLIGDLPKEIFRTETPDGGSADNFVHREPKGVIAAICPWNLPLLLATWKTAPALACGNTVVLKPSEETPTTASMLGDVMNKAGVPPGVFNVIQGFGPGSAGEFLVRHPDVDGITFTGETGTGEIIMKAAATGVRNVSFELGGKNAAIVFADCDIDEAVSGITRSAFANCGQVCFGTERIYVQRPLFDDFVDRLKSSAEALILGPPDHPNADMGPLISQEHRSKVLKYFELAIDSNAKLITGGGIPAMPNELQQGSWIKPTIWTGLGDDSTVNQEEVFGPCCHIAPFDEESEVIQRANATRYGLCGCVWTTDAQRARRIASSLAVGIVWVNTWFLRDLRTPLGGRGISGIGREGGTYGLDFYTELKNVCTKN